MRLSIFILALIAGLSGVTNPALAQYPDRPVRIVVPFAPGGGLDILTRLAGRALNDSWKQSVVIDNRTGANGLIGMEIVARADPGGYTLMAMASGRLDEHNLRYFSPIALFATTPYLFTVHPGLKTNSIRDLIALAKAHPGKFNYASTGSGAVSHLSFELFRSMAGIDVKHIPYKGIGQAIPDLVGGRVEMVIGPIQALLPHVKANRLLALGVSNPQRLSTMPDIPTIAESGLPGYESRGWFGLFAPARTPGAIIAGINTEVRRGLQSPEAATRLAEIGAEASTFRPNEFLAFIRHDNAKWEKVIGENNIEVERPRLRL